MELSGQLRPRSLEPGSRGPSRAERFEVDVKWWLAGEDWRNVAGRLVVVRQTGAVRARAELFPGGDVAEDREVITDDLAADDGAPRPNGG